MNCIMFAKFLLGKKEDLAFNSKSIEVKAVFETVEMKSKVLTKYAESSR
jgi:hypothetical protein